MTSRRGMTGRSVAQVRWFCEPGTLLRQTGDTITFDRRRYRSTNAQAEALNTKIKAFRAQLLTVCSHGKIPVSQQKPCQNP